MSGRCRERAAWWRRSSALRRQLQQRISVIQKSEVFAQLPIWSMWSGDVKREDETSAPSTLRDHSYPQEKQVNEPEPPNLR